MVWQLQIDFSIPFELTPTLEELTLTLLNFGTTDIPYTVYKLKKNRRL